MREIFKIGLLTFFLTYIPLGIASNNTSDDTTPLRASLKQHFPDLSITEVIPSPIKDLYQVTAGSVVIYVTKDGRYVFSGDIIDLQNQQKNLTENARKKARLAGLKALGEENMIVFSPKNPKYTVTVFTDVDCGYCRKLQSEISEINEKGIAIRYLAFPRTGPNTPTFDKMVKVWCAKDKRKAFSEAKNDKKIDSKACDNNQIMQEFQFGLMAGVNGTPTLIFEDGSMYPGYLSPDELLRTVEKIQKEAKS